MEDCLGKIVQRTESEQLIESFQQRFFFYPEERIKICKENTKKEYCFEKKTISKRGKESQCVITKYR